MKVVLMVAPRAAGEIERHGLPFLSVGYIASSLLLDQHEVLIVDAHAFDLSPAETAEKILELGAEALGISATTHNRFPAIETAKLVKQANPSVKIFAGGPHFGLSARDALRVVPEIDYIVKGEGEITSCELLKTNFDQNKLAGVLGLVYRDALGKIIENPDRPFIQNLDELPMPAWHLFELEKYPGTTSIEKTGLKNIGIISSRGCPNQCIFCSSIALHKGRLRLRSPKNFVDELEYLYKTYGYRAFNFYDDTFSIVRGHAVDICEEIIRRDLKIYWYASGRVNTVDKELLALMKKSGCVRINFGIESGSPRMLKIIKKGITMEQARAAVKAAVMVGLEVTLNFLMVYPYETWADIALTVDAIKEFRSLSAVMPSYSFIIIYPGTELERIAKKEGLMPEDFSWNSPYKSDKYYLAGEDPSVPYFEWPELPFEKVKAFVLNRLLTKKQLWSRFLIKAKRVRKPADVKTIFKIGAKYLESWLKKTI